ARHRPAPARRGIQVHPAGPAAALGARQGMFAAGAVALVGFAPTVFALGAAYFLATTLSGLQPGWKEMDRDRLAHPPVGGMVDEHGGARTSAGR
ncbi:MAG: hypothetical protein M3455_01355, partial [Actinomycetota bacterium]|nr:hypothetical protein [Actinomycetota bacterium]